MTWSKAAWQNAQPAYEQIVKMPFIEELMAGTLAKEKFFYYIAQDALYLEHFGRALSLIAARASRKDHVLDFIRFAEGAIVVESALHGGYLKDVRPGTMAPACHHYTSFLLSTASLAPVEVAMAAVLPCFWVYKEVGDHILKYQNKGTNPYQQWIDTYGGEAFAVLVKKAITICDEVAATTTPDHRDRMTEAFLAGCQLEWMFWDSAWRLEQWPAA